jgi:hypothetical protein
MLRVVIKHFEEMLDKEIEEVKQDDSNVAVFGP